MALDLGRSFLLVLGGLVLFAAPACSVESKGDDDDDDDDDACLVDFDCRNGEICGPDDICIPDPNDGSGGSGSGGTNSGGTNSGGTNSGGTNSGGTSSGGTSSGGTSSGGTSSGGTSSGGTSSVAGSGPTAGTGGTAVCSEDDLPTCPSADSMTVCLDGVNETITCVEFCEVIFGFETGACEADQGCLCGDALDAECDLGVSAFCSCVDPACTPEEALDFYISCFANDPPADAAALRCLDDYVDVEAGTVACADGFDACIPE